MRLTIIIPMYKTEKYISDCLNSILNQDKGNIDYDIVAVNDGSPDKTAEIAERILSKSNIKYTIINQQNKGLSCARNAGLKIAHGDFIWFIDSDDTIAENSFRTLSKIEADNIDAIAINGLEKIEETLKPCVRYGKFAENAVDGHTFFQSSIWSVCSPMTLYNSNFLKANNLEFHPHIYHEDNEFTTRAYFFAERIYIADSPLYIIRETPNSKTRTFNPKRSFDLMTVANLLEQFKKDNATDKKDIKVFRKMISICLNSALENNLKYSESDRYKLSEALFANRRLFKNMLNYPSLKYKIEAGLFLLFPKQIVTIYNILNKLLRR